MKARVLACTIIAHNYLPLARLVARSFLDHHPDGRFVVALIDRPAESMLLEGECFEVLRVSDIELGPEGFAYMATAYNVTEFATSVKPYVLRQLVDEAECVLYLDPDIYVYAPLDPLIDATIEHGWSLTPHCLQPIVRNGDGPTEAEIMAAGVYNLGYVGVTSRARGFLDWWADRLRRDAIIDPSHQLFTDQRWIDLAVPLFSPYIEQDPTYNVAYWNLDQRHLWFDGETPMVGSDLLRFFHFSGYNPKTPHWLSKYQPHQPRVLMSAQPDVARLCDDYAKEMVRYSVGTGPVASYGWSEACPGLPFNDALRALFRHELIESDKGKMARPPTPFVPGGVAPFLLWLTTVPHDSARRLPRYLDTVWSSRPDLVAEFEEVGWGDISRFLLWARRSGRHESDLIKFVGLPPATIVERSVAADVGREPNGVDVIGYFQAELGVGEAGRLLQRALVEADVPTETISCVGTPSRQQHGFQSSGFARHATTILSVNADQFGAVRHQFGGDFFVDRYVIGQWFWEVEKFPESYRGAFGLLHEVWVATEHIQNALLAARPKVAVELMPLPLLAPVVAPGVDRAAFGLTERYMFLFAFDMLSVFERKNPLAVIQAFTMAFTPDEGPVLVIKTINGSRNQESMEKLRWAARHRADITIIDEYFDVAMAAALMNTCDCYVSLHRAEGLGLTMSEAMTLGKPVIATGYSGNLDFMTPDTAYLVPWEPKRIGKDAAPYPADAEWAEPDVHVASRYMRDVATDSMAASRVGQAAAADLAARFSPAVVGARMRQRLEQIWEA